MMAQRIPGTALLALLALAVACSGDRTTGTSTGPGLSADRSGTRGSGDRKHNDGRNDNQNNNQNRNDDQDQNPQNPNRNENENDQNDEQEFVAQLMPLNGNVMGGGAVGEAELKIEHGVLTVKIEAEGLAPSIVHMQHIHALHACPTPAADTNHDGIIDFVEGLPFYGAVIVPLDSDISNGGTVDVYPTADANGRIRYEASASVATLEAALGGPLDLANRAIVLHGVVGPLPGTVSPANPAALPVACGPVMAQQEH